MAYKDLNADNIYNKSHVMGNFTAILGGTQAFTQITFAGTTITDGVLGGGDWSIPNGVLNLTGDGGNTLHINNNAPQILFTDTGGTTAKIDANSTVGNLVLGADPGNTGASTQLKLQVDGTDGLIVDSSQDVSIPNGTLATKAYTVATLPAAGTAGRRAFVTDANATTFASIVAAGGANGVPVYDDGTNWRIG